MRNFDKILMTGAQGTGKTTLLKALQNEPEFDNWKFYTNVVRTMVEEEGIAINKEGTSESQKKNIRQIHPNNGRCYETTFH